MGCRTDGVVLFFRENYWDPQHRYVPGRGRELLWWYIEEVQGPFPDDALDPHAPLFPSERLPAALGAEVAGPP